MRAEGKRSFFPKVIISKSLFVNNDSLIHLMQNRKTLASLCGWVLHNVLDVHFLLVCEKYLA